MGQIFINTCGSDQERIQTTFSVRCRGHHQNMTSTSTLNKSYWLVCIWSPCYLSSNYPGADNAVPQVTVQEYLPTAKSNLEVILVWDPMDATLVRYPLPLYDDLPLTTVKSFHKLKHNLYRLAWLCLPHWANSCTSTSQITPTLAWSRLTTPRIPFFPVLRSHQSTETILRLK